MISYTLGPSTTFACPAVSRLNLSNGVTACTTYAAIQSAPDIATDDTGKVIWMWKGTVEGGLDEPPSKKQSAKVRPHSFQIFGYLIFMLL